MSVLPPRRRPRLGRLATVAIPAVVLLVVTVAPGLGQAAWAAGGASAAPPPARGRGARLALVDQTTWVTPGQPFALDLGVTGRGPPGQALAVDVGVFDRLHTRSALTQTLDNHIPTPRLAAFGPLGLSSLPPAPRHPGAVQVAVKVATSGGSTPARGGGPVLHLSCPGSCAGVYPVRIRLRDAGTGRVLDQLTTYLVLTGPVPDAHKLDLAWALRLTAPPRLRADGAPVLAPGWSTHLRALSQALTAHPSVPLTLAPSPLTLAALDTSPTPADRAALAGLRAWAGNPAHQVIARPYAPVAPGTLARAGLGDQLEAQVARGDQIVGQTLGVRPSTSTWLASGRLDRAGLGLLTSLPAGAVTHVILNQGDLAPLPETFTSVQPVHLSQGGSSLEAMTTDRGLSAHFSDTRPVLAAHQLLADLALVYFEQPNATYRRGVTLVSPRRWQPNAAFLDAVLSALSTSPIVQPVTMGQFFDQVQPATIEGVDLVRTLASPTSTGHRASLPPAAAIRADQTRLGAFTSILAVKPQRVPVIGRLHDLLLLSESAGVPPGARASYLMAFDHLLGSQLAQIRLPTETVTLTARKGKLPVTITSALPYPVHGLLEVRSDGLTFPTHRSSQPATLRRSTVTVSFAVRARANGEFPARVQLLSPNGDLVVATSRFAVRSSTFNAVAIGLSVAAGLVLVLWWGLSLRRGRRDRNRHAVVTEE